MVDLVARLSNGHEIGAIREIERFDIDNAIERGHLVEELNQLVHHAIDAENEATARRMVEDALRDIDDGSADK